MLILDSEKYSFDYLLLNQSNDVYSCMEVPLRIIFVCVVLGLFLVLYPFGKLAFASLLELVCVCKSFLETENVPWKTLGWFSFSV